MRTPRSRSLQKKSKVTRCARVSALRKMLRAIAVPPEHPPAASFLSRGDLERSSNCSRGSKERQVECKVLK